MIDIALYGGLETFFGESLRLDVRTPEEVFWALAAQCDAFFQHVLDSAKDGVGYRVIVDDEEIDESGLSLPVIRSISIAPAIAGAGDLGRIILGAVLIVGSFFLPGAILGISSVTIGSIGAALVYGGIVSLLTPKPSNEAGKNQNSFILDPSGQPRSYQGEAKPVLFGDWWIENPPIISLWLDTENIPIDWQAV
jgi:predicted phage tail protein